MIYTIFSKLDAFSVLHSRTARHTRKGRDAGVIHGGQRGRWEPCTPYVQGTERGPRPTGSLVPAPRNHPGGRRAGLLPPCRLLGPLASTWGQPSAQPAQLSFARASGNFPTDNPTGPWPEESSPEGLLQARLLSAQAQLEPCRDTETAGCVPCPCPFAELCLVATVFQGWRRCLTPNRLMPAREAGIQGWPHGGSEGSLVPIVLACMAEGLQRQPIVWEGTFLWNSEGRTCRNSCWQRLSHGMVLASVLRGRTRKATAQHDH